MILLTDYLFASTLRYSLAVPLSTHALRRGQTLLARSEGTLGVLRPCPDKISVDSTVMPNAKENAVSEGGAPVSLPPSFMCLSPRLHSSRASWTPRPRNIMKKFSTIMKKAIVLALLIAPLVSFASFDRNLYYGLQSDPQVQELQEFLKDEGIYSGPITGNFFSLTLSAVKQFQTAHSVSPASGYFGPITRAKANDTLSSKGVSGSSVTTEDGTPAPISVVPPKTTDNVVFSLMEQIKLLQQQLAALQQSQQTLSAQATTIQTIQQEQKIQTEQIAKQTQTLQQIQQNTTPPPTIQPQTATPPPPATTQTTSPVTQPTTILTPTPAPIPTPATPTPAPKIEVSVSSDNPVGKNILKGEKGITILKLDIENSGGVNVRLDNLKLRLVGTSFSNFQDLKIKIGGQLYSAVYTNGDVKTYNPSYTLNPKVPIQVLAQADVALTANDNSFHVEIIGVGANTVSSGESAKTYDVLIGNTFTIYQPPITNNSPTVSLVPNTVFGLTNNQCTSGCSYIATRLRFDARNNPFSILKIVLTFSGVDESDIKNVILNSSYKLYPTSTYSANGSKVAYIEGNKVIFQNFSPYELTHINPNETSDFVVEFQSNPSGIGKTLRIDLANPLTDITASNYETGLVLSVDGSTISGSPIFINKQ